MATVDPRQSLLKFSVEYAALPDSKCDKQDFCAQLACIHGTRHQHPPLIQVIQDLSQIATDNQTALSNALELAKKVSDCRQAIGAVMQTYDFADTRPLLKAQYREDSELLLAINTHMASISAAIRTENKMKGHDAIYISDL